MAAITSELREKVVAIVADTLEVDAAELTDDSDFVEDHEADSLVLIEIFAKLEQQLGVRIPPERMTELTSLATACDLVALHLPAQAVHE